MKKKKHRIQKFFCLLLAGLIIVSGIVPYTAYALEQSAESELSAEAQQESMKETRNLVSNTSDTETAVDESNINQCYILAAEMSDVTDGTAPFDKDNAPGNDSSSDNGIVRSFDSINYSLKYTTALRDATNQGIDRAKIMCQFVLPADPKKAVFNLDSMAWLVNKQLVYLYTDGTESMTYDPEKTVSKQTLTGYRQLVNNQSNISIPGSGTLAVAVNVTAATSKDIIKPVFTIWAEGNADHEKKELTETTQVSSAPKFDLEIKRNPTSNVLAYYNKRLGTATDEPINADDVYGRLQTYAISIRLVNDSVDKGMRGIEYPDGSNITFDIRLSETSNGDDVSYTEEYHPFMWDYKMDNGIKTIGKLHRDMQPLGQLGATYGGWTTKTPYNNGNEITSCYNGGTMTITEDSADSNLLHVTLENYQLDMQDFDFPSTYGGNLSNPYRIDANIGYFSVGLLQTIAQFPTDVSEIENVTVKAELSNIKATAVSGAQVTTEENLQNNLNSVVIVKYPKGEHSKENRFFLGDRSNVLRATGWNAGDAYGYVGESIQINSGMRFSGDGYLASTNILMKMEDAAFSVPAGSDAYSSYKCMNERSQIGTVNTLFAAKPDKTGWKNEDEINNTREEQLIYFRNIDDLVSAGYTCVGILYEVRESKIYPYNNEAGITFYQKMSIRPEAKIGKVYITKNDVRSWRKNCEFSYLNLVYDDGIKAYGIGDYTWTDGTYTQDYPTPSYRTDTNYSRAIYEEGTMVDGHINGFLGGNSVLIIGNHVQTNIQVAEESDGKPKIVYDLDIGERTAQFKIEPKMSLNTENSENLGDVSYDDLFITAVLPKGLTFSKTGCSRNPDRVTVNADGTTTIKWTINHAAVLEGVDPIVFSTVIGEEGTKEDVKHNDHLVVKTSIISTNDQRVATVANGKLATTEISVIKLAASSVIKRVITPLVELNEDIIYRLRYSNLSDIEAVNANLYDILPYNNDGRTTDYQGAYHLKEVTINYTKASETFTAAKDKAELFVSEEETARKRDNAEQILNANTSDGFLTAGTKTVVNDSKTISWTGFESFETPKAILLKLGNIVGNEYLDVYVTLSPKNTADDHQNPGNLYANDFMQYADKQASIVTSNRVIAKTVSRLLSGCIWIDSNEDGIRDDTEKLYQDAEMSLWKTEKSEYDTSDIAKTVNGITLYPAYNAFGEKIAAITTGSDGYYSFDTLLSGEYYVLVENTKGYEITKQNQGKDDTVDSDAASEDKTVYIASITLPALENMMEEVYESRHNDIGLICAAPILGELELRKESAKPELTDGNPCYSLEGAVYDVFSDEAMTESAGELVTQADGTTNTLILNQGTYYVKEKTASPGYKLCDSTTGDDADNKGVHIVKVEPGKKTTFTCKEEPLHDPFLLRLQKLDADSGKPIPAGTASLEGAQFEVTYYANTAGTVSGTPTRTWVFETDANGMLRMNDPTRLVSEKSDALYYSEDNILIYPLGTYRIREIQPPKYYQMKGTLQVMGTNTRADVTTGVVLVLAEENDRPVYTQGGSRLSADNLALDVLEEVYKGSVRIQKKDTNGSTPLAGVEFTLKAPGGSGQKVVTDKNGTAVFENLVPQTYVLTETKTVNGHSLLAEPIEVTIPLRMTEEEIAASGADKSKAVWDEEAGCYCFYDATYTITNSVTLDMPMTGGNPVWMYLMMAAAAVSIVVGVYFKKHIS